MSSSNPEGKKENDTTRAAVRKLQKIDNLILQINMKKMIQLLL